MIKAVRSDGGGSGDAPPHASGACLTAVPAADQPGGGRRRSTPSYGAVVVAELQEQVAADAAALRAWLA